MSIPNATLAVVPPEKLADYLLNPLHPVGGPQARWFISLGYHSESPERLARDLLEVARRGERFTTHPSVLGVKYVVSGRIATPCGRMVDVVTVWIAEPKMTGPRLVTAYPGKESSNE